MKLGYGAVILMAMLAAGGVQADSVTHGGTTVNMDFVNIGDGGALGNPLAGGANVADSTGYGSVGYNYQMGKYEVTAAQWASVIAADSRIGDAGSGSGSLPTRSTSWYEAAKFANWLTSGSAVNGAYQFNSDGLSLLSVNRAMAVSTYGTVYVLPSEDEWYKAAYYKPANDGSYSLYANGSDNAADLVWGTSSGWNYHSGSSLLIGSPNFTWNAGFGGEEQNGTCDMMGNVPEWVETAYDGSLDNVNEGRALRGGAYNGGELDMRSSSRKQYGPWATNGIFGFRVAAIPEPGVISLMAVFGGGLWFVRRYFSGV